MPYALIPVPYHLKKQPVFVSEKNTHLNTYRYHNKQRTQNRPRHIAIPTLDVGMAIILLVFIALLPISTPRIYATDEVQYYAYIRSVYFDHDLDFRNEYEHFAHLGMSHGDPSVYNALLRHRDDDPPVNPNTGKLRNLAPVGAALMWSPGFVLADVGVRIAQRVGVNVVADGYSKPYIWAVCFMTALYALLGLLLTYRLARRFTSMFAATLATITVWLASPLVFYSSIAMPWPHAVAFFLFAAFLTVWLDDWDSSKQAMGMGMADRLAQRPVYTWVLLGVLGGLMTMTREQLALMMVLLAVEGLIAYGQTWRSWPLGGSIPILLKRHALLGACFLLTLTPQLLKYQILNGRPFPSSVVSGKLKSSGGISPHFFDTLIDVHHGAFLWSPVLLLGIIGLVVLARRHWLLAALLGLGFVVQTYLNGSFGTTWHLSGAFGFRRLIECTPIFVIGLAALLEYLRVRMGHWPLIVGAAFLIYWNVGLIAQWTIVRPAMREGLIWNGMLSYQFVEVPMQVSSKLVDLLFHRCRIVENQTC